MENVFFKPWIGKDYETGGIFHKKILVLGESHYCKDGVCEDCGNIDSAGSCAEYTESIVKSYLNGTHGRWTATLRKFEHSLNPDADSETIWNSIAFYNYLQVSQSGPRKAAKYEDYAIAEVPFFEILDELKPNLIIVWGVTRMWLNMPGGDRWREGKELKVGDHNIKNGYYKLADGNEVRVIWINHPSSPFSPELWHKVIKIEL